MRQTTLAVTDMSCAGCEGDVTDALEAIKEGAATRADRENDEGRVEHDEATIDTASLAAVPSDISQTRTDKRFYYGG